MKLRRYIPERGDLVWLNFQPRVGHEQSGRRPAVVLSPKLYNRPSRLALVCPITNQCKGYPFEVLLPEGLAVQGVVLSDQIKSVDWQARQAERAGKLDSATFNEVIEKAKALVAG